MLTELDLQLQQLIETDLKEPPVGRARRFLEDQKALLPDSETLADSAGHGVFASLLLLPFLLPAGLATLAVESRQRRRLRRQQRRVLTQARALLAELQAQAPGGATAAERAHPFRQGSSPQDVRSAEGLLLLKAEQVWLIRYQIAAPQPWKCLRSFSGLALVYQQQGQPELLWNAYCEGRSRPQERLVRDLGPALTAWLGPRFAQLEHCWLKGELEPTAAPASPASPAL